MTGALFGTDVFQDDRHFDVGHQLVAIAPEAFQSREGFERRLEELVAQIKSAPPIDTDEPVMLPGEREQPAPTREAGFGNSRGPHDRRESAPARLRARRRFLRRRGLNGVSRGGTTRRTRRARRRNQPTLSGRSNLKYCLKSRTYGGRPTRTKGWYLYDCAAPTTWHCPLVGTGGELQVPFAEKKYFTFLLDSFFEAP